MYLKSIIYGASDGIITDFNIISGATWTFNVSHFHIYYSTYGVDCRWSFNGNLDFLSYKAEKEENPKSYKNEEPYKHGLVTFASFVAFGLLPLTLYLVITRYSRSIFISLCLYVLGISFTLLDTPKSLLAKYGISLRHNWFPMV